MSKQVVFEIPGGETLKLSAVSGATAYSDLAASVAVSLPLTIVDDQVIYFADAIDRTPVTLTVTDAAGAVLVSEHVIPGNRPVGVETFRVDLTAKQRRQVSKAESNATFGLLAPDYVAGRAYVLGELVTHSGTLYRITTAYTSSGGSLDLSKATAIGGGGGAVSSVVGQTGAVTGTQIVADSTVAAALAAASSAGSAYQAVFYR